MLRLKKSLGQNFLIDKNIIGKITRLDSIKNKTVLEIGAGSGNLTNSILKKRPKEIILIEKDKRFYENLSKKFNTKKNCKIVNEDILSYDLNSFTKPETIVFGNLPYNISTQILAKFIRVNSWPPFYQKIIFMFQKEVADRILAKSNTKQYGRITVLSNLRFNITENFKISKNCFFPRPKVDSKIITFQPKDKINYKISNVKNLEKITQIFFSSKRKMINKAFSRVFQNHKDVAKKLKIDLNSRPSELTCEDYYRLTEHFEKINYL